MKDKFSTMTTEDRKMVEELDDRVRAIEGKLSRILNIVTGIAIGLAVGACVFGYLSIKDLVSIVK